MWGLVTQGRETRDLGTSRMGHGDVLDGDARHQIQGCEDVKYRDMGGVNDYCKSRKEMRYQSLPSRISFGERNPPYPPYEAKTQ